MSRSVVKNDETTAEAKDSRSYWGFVLWPCVIILAYVLSSGPAFWLVDRKIINDGLLNAYIPVIWVFGNGPRALSKPLGMYWHLWAPKLFTKDGDFRGTF